MEKAGEKVSMTPQEEQFKAEYDVYARMVNHLPPEKKERGARFLTRLIEMYNESVELFGNRKK